MFLIYQDISTVCEETVFCLVTEAWQLITVVAIQANAAFPRLSGLHSTQPFSQRALFGCPCMWWAIIGHREFVQAATENRCEQSHTVLLDNALVF